uniref:Uncharacterized protein n=1 Tax=viral metagenome TaxID=1070528 RepID=A0A6C0K1M8_9ZZZZ
MTTFGQPPGYLGSVMGLNQPAAAAGSCRLQPTMDMIRPKIGGRRRTRKQIKKATRRRQQKGGFLPSIGEPFVAAVSKYISPLALYGIYKFMNGTKKNKRKGRRV